MSGTVRIFLFGLRVGREDFRAFFASWKVWFLAWGIRSISSAAMIALLGRVLGSVEQVHYLLIGNAVIVGAHSAAWAIQSSTWDRFDGTYPMLVVSPAGLRPSLMGRAGIWVFGGFITSLTTFVALALLFRMPLSFPGAFLAPLFFGVICVSTYAFALAVGSFVIRVARARNIIHSFVLTTVAAFTGANVPIAFWPAWVEAVALVLPVTHGLSALRALLTGGPPRIIALGLALEIVVAAAWFVCSWLTMNAMANAGRADGSIDFAGI